MYRRIFFILYIGSTQFGTARYHDDTPPAYSLLLHLQPLKFVCHHLIHTHTHTAGRVLLGIPPNNKGQISTIYFSSVFPREMTTGVVEQLSLSLSSSNLFFFYTYTSNTRWGLIGWTCKYRPEKKKEEPSLHIYIYFIIIIIIF